MKAIESEVTTKTSRIEAFSDGVFAIAITLLILDIHPPHALKDNNLLGTLLHDWPSFLALLIGFFTLLVCWINHHYMFSMITRSNSVLSLLNGFKLLVVTITPFATALLSKNIQSAWFSSSVSVYCFNFFLMGSAMTAVWRYAKGQGFTKTRSEAELTAVTRLYTFASILSSVIWLVSYVSMIVCLLLFVVMFIIFVFPERVVALQMRRMNTTKTSSLDVSLEVAPTLESQG